MRLSLRLRCVLPIAVAGVMLACDSGEGGPAPEGAEVTVYVAKSIVTVDAERPRAQAVAVSEGRIVAVGTRDEVLERVGDGVVVDARFSKQVIVPGLIDQHLHPMLAALTFVTQIVSIEDWTLPTGHFPAARSAGEYLARLRELDASLEAGEPLFTWGYHQGFHGPLDRARLDSVSLDRPIVVLHRSVHETLFNSAALEMLGLDEALVASQPEVVRAQIDLEKGHFFERGNFEVATAKVLPRLAPPQKLAEGMALAAAFMHAAGVTTSAEPGGAPEYTQLAEAVLGDARTPFRFYFIADGRAANAGHDEDLVAVTESLRAKITSRTAPLDKQVKLFADGAMFSQLMQMRDGYTDGHHGEWLMEPETFGRAFARFWDAGYQIHIHQNGDAGLDLVLDTLEENLARSPRSDHRTTLVHFGFSAPDQVERIAKLGAIVSANPYYTVALADRYAEHGIGPERANQMVRLGDVGRAGVSFSLHSDMPMAPSRPLFLMACAVNRTTPSGRVAGPNQRVSVEQALRAVTLEAAYSLRLEDEIGSIEPGKLANFTILDEDPFEVEPQRLAEIGIWGTVLEGRLQPVAPLDLR